MQESIKDLGDAKLLSVPGKIHLKESRGHKIIERGILTL